MYVLNLWLILEIIDSYFFRVKNFRGMYMLSIPSNVS